ncbi:MAG: type II toxin-antitoxin system VapC family toxin [Planctomycetota bacterium]|jgi:toxin-antitoxin system PIN domain toxin
MIAVDTNLLVYAHRRDSAWHEPARNCVKAAAEGRAPWAIPWHCLHEFLAIVTHPKIYRPPTPLAKALEQVSAWLESPSLVVMSETATYWESLRHLLANGQVTGAKVHDARVAAVCSQHGVRELWSADRDFSRFPGVTVKNPLVL